MSQKWEVANDSENGNYLQKYIGASEPISLLVGQDLPEEQLESIAFTLNNTEATISYNNQLYGTKLRVSFKEYSK